MHIIYMTLTCIHLYVNVSRGIFRAQSNVSAGASLQILQKSFIVDAQPGSKYDSVMSFTAEMVYRMLIFI